MVGINHPSLTVTARDVEELMGVMAVVCQTAEKFSKMADELKMVNVIRMQKESEATSLKALNIITSSVIVVS